MSEESLQAELARLQAEHERLRRRLEREHRARLEAEAIAERGTRELYDRQRELALLNAVTDAANAADTVDAAIQVALDQMCAFTSWPIGHAYLVTPGTPPHLAST